MWTRVAFATRISLSIGLIGTFTGFFIGIALGGIAGFFGGWTDFAIQRLTEVIMSIPTLPFWLAAASIIPPEWTALQTYFVITIILGLFGWTSTARRVRGQILALRETDYVIAARLSGNSNARLIVRHMLPSVASYIIVDLTIAFPSMILAETALSFLGLGLRPPVVSWGVLIQAAQNIRAIEQAPWLFIPSASSSSRSSPSTPSAMACAMRPILIQRSSDMHPCSKRMDCRSALQRMAAASRHCRMSILSFAREGSPAWWGKAVQARVFWHCPC